jgi:hypothetical protein
MWHNDTDRGDPNRSCYRNPLQQELDEDDIVHAMAGSVEILLPTETQWKTRSDVVTKCVPILTEELMQVSQGI